MTRHVPARTIRLDIEYDGTRYFGWQVQRCGKGKQERYPTVAGAIEAVLKKMLGEKVTLIAAGRTDTGVHACGQVAHFTTRSSLSLERLHKGLNALLADDIAIRRVTQERPGFHSRFQARAKHYRYTIFNGPCRSALNRRYAAFCPYPLDLRLMRAEARVLLGRHDFSAFRSSSDGRNSNVRTVRELTIRRKEGFVYIDIVADGFLYNMVRIIVGTLIEIGRGKLSPGSIRAILRARDKKRSGPTAAACGLCLMKVEYEDVPGDVTGRR